jgi:CheY-like chemotaxis protein
MRYVPSSAVVRTDIRLLRRIIQNFLTNAIRYTAAGGVLLGCRRLSHGLRIDVCDTGPGIPADKLDEIFEEFKQLQPQSGRGDAGLGLGLAIVRRAARSLDLTIHTRSRIGHGSVFGVVVPFGAGNVATLASAVPARPSAPSVHATVMVIDDQPRVLAGMEALLGGWGCTVLTAASGREASNMLPHLTLSPDLVIADYHLGNAKTGVVAIDRIRAALGKALPGIVITADQSTETQNTVKRHGYWLLQKPVNPARLRSLLGAALG